MPNRTLPGHAANRSVLIEDLIPDDQMSNLFPASRSGNWGINGQGFPMLRWSLQYENGPLPSLHFFNELVERHTNRI